MDPTAFSTDPYDTVGTTLGKSDFNISLYFTENEYKFHKDFRINLSKNIIIKLSKNIIKIYLSKNTD